MRRAADEQGDHETLLHLSLEQFVGLTANALHGRFRAHGRICRLHLPLGKYWEQSFRIPLRGA